MTDDNLTRITGDTHTLYREEFCADTPVSEQLNPYIVALIDDGTVSAVDNYFSQGLDPGSMVLQALQGHYMEAWLHAHALLQSRNVWMTYLDYFGQVRRLTRAPKPPGIRLVSKIESNAPVFKVYAERNDKYLGEIYQLSDGEFVYDPDGSGCWSGHQLQVLADELALLNLP